MLASAATLGRQEGSHGADCEFAAVASRRAIDEIKRLRTDRDKYRDLAVSTSDEGTQFYWKDLAEQLRAERDEYQILYYETMGDEPGESIEKLRAERDELRAVVERLPKTADGVPVHPGDEVWYGRLGPRGGMKGPHSYTVTVYGEVGDIHATGEEGGYMSESYGLRVSECYSTREAAEAAVKETDGQPDPTD